MNRSESESDAPLVAAATWGGTLGTLVGLRLWYFADVLPNTYYAKRSWDFDGPGYVTSFLRVHGWLAAAAVLGSLAVVRTAHRKSVAAAAAVLGSIVLFGLVAKGDWMREWRFLVLAVPFMLLPPAQVFALASEVKWRFTWRRLLYRIELRATPSAWQAWRWLIFSSACTRPTASRQTAGPTIFLKAPTSGPAARAPGRPGARLARLLGELGARDTLPATLVSDNGPEFTGQALDKWATDNKVNLHFIRPGKPTENAFIESFNGRFRNECLNTTWFTDLDDARRVIEAWRNDYNDVRPHGSLDGRTPSEYERDFTQGLPSQVA